jgi:hypothetical protein
VQLGSHGVAATAFGRGWDVLNGQWAEADYGLANGDGVSTGDNMVGYFVEFTPGSVADVNDNAPELARSVSSVIVTKAIAPADAARLNVSVAGCAFTRWPTVKSSTVSSALA